MSKKHNYPIIAIGSSAGGVNTLGDLLSKLDPKIDAAYIIVQHLSAYVLSQLPSILQARTELPVVKVENDINIKSGNIYIAVPGQHLVVKGNKLLLDDSPRVNFSKPSITKLFKSVAYEYKERAVGILLTGAGSDGAQGILEIKKNGGWTIAQDPALAAYPSMPKSAIDTGGVDFVLSVRDMPSYISEIVNEPKLLLKELRSDEYQEIMDYMVENQNTQFSNYKQTTIKRRIKNRISTLGLHEPSDYLKVLKTNDSEINHLINNLLINVTGFFRDKEAFAELEKQLRHILLTKNDNDPIRIWTAGCSTGEEVYSLAILLHEILGENFLKREIKLFATDIDNEAIEKARHGFYEEDSFENVPEHFIGKYFNKTDKGYKVNKTIRSVVIFGVNDLTTAAPIAKVDLITCRNVMIYFNKELQKKVLRLFHYALNKDGLLFLGKSESNLLAPDIFTPISTQYKIYQKINMNISLSLADKKRQIIEADEIAQASIYSAVEYNEISRFFEKILQNTNDSIISINKSNKITSINQTAVKFFNLDKEKVLNTIIGDSIKGLITNEVLIDIDRTIKTNDTTIRDLHVYRDPLGNEKYFYITYVPFGDTLHVIDQVIMIIRDITATVMLKEQVLQLKQQNQEQVNQMSILNEELQSSNEELETTNEELQATNEELETTNEELQSTNEELETTNEELQSTNSEMVSTNLELRSLYEEQEAQRLELEIKTKALAEVNENLQQLVDEKIKELRARDDILIQQSRLASMGEMLGNIAHQWRQPLNVINILAGNIAITYEKGMLDSKNIEKLEKKITTQTRYLSNTIDDFRNFFHPNKEKNEFFMDEAIQKSVDIIKFSLDHCGIGLEVDLIPKLNVMGYENEFKQVLINIINNAKDALVTNDIKDPMITIGTYIKQKRIAVSIGDNAGGIAKDVLPRVFEPYFTTKFESKGTGLGLYMAKSIIEQSMGGNLSVKNENGGAVFIIEIPK